VREGFQKIIDRMMHPLLSCLLDQFQNTVRQGHFGVGRNHVNVVWLQGHSVLGFPNRQSGGSRQKATQNALVSGVQVLNQHKSHAAIGGQVLQQFRKSFQSAG